MPIAWLAAVPILPIIHHHAIAQQDRPPGVVGHFGIVGHKDDRDTADVQLLKDVQYFSQS